MKDFSGDGKITQKDVLIGRGVLQKEGDKFVAKQYGGIIRADKGTGNKTIGKKERVGRPIVKKKLALKKKKEKELVEDLLFGGPAGAFAKQSMKYQLYGGTNKNMRDGNKAVSQFYNEGE